MRSRRLDLKVTFTGITCRRCQRRFEPDEVCPGCGRAPSKRKKESMVRQQQIDEVVGRIKAAVAKHGQGNPKLQDLQGAYEVLHKTPNDGMALALVEIELEKLGG